jgi:hypothetical protein
MSMIINVFKVMFCCELNTIINWKWMSFDCEKYEEGNTNSWTTNV